MCIRDRAEASRGDAALDNKLAEIEAQLNVLRQAVAKNGDCLLYTSDAADERSSVDLGGRRIITKKKHTHNTHTTHTTIHTPTQSHTDSPAAQPTSPLMH